ncbi:Uncharacterized membrane protein YkoI [Tessaracoccus bendigoensis DSM 12906]|uniref:Uncharacterized membrane protein YkoI n=1 Tax=Tessaracoccus bendigoensis DSM 12906 TaxID=1123357 RepID=A0A1M6AC54_9ACTN|nr:PepSY domain-containing protein [Tessaracoccus bendigoensis]SHI34090.1 Uncharacterized membrane protein YkoI [Tessaracoccus bendigoensis DSM 12906]
MPTTRPSSLALTSLAAAALLLPTACSTPSSPEVSPTGTSPSVTAPIGSPSAESTPTATTEGTPTPTDEASATAVPEGPLDATRAIEAALAHSPGAVVEIDAERRAWEVTVIREDGTGVELTIDAQSGEVTRTRDTRLSLTQSTAPQISATEAIGIALGNTPGEVIELDLDTERGTLVWEVLVRAEAGGRVEIYVDATTGEVLKVEVDD